jgi:hypothetical protein
MKRVSPLVGFGYAYTNDDEVIMQTLPDVSFQKEHVGRPARIAFGEWLGIDVPTRYSAESHEFFNLTMIGDSVITPMLFGMSSRTVWVCRALVAVLFITRKKTDSLSMRQALQVEAATGLTLMVLAAQGTISRRWWENAYLMFGGALMILNALMTEMDD